MADHVMRMPESAIIQRKCAACKDEDDSIQRKPLASFIQRKETSGGMMASDTVTSMIDVSNGGGHLLDNNNQSFMQSRFGTDFSHVKIHTGNESVQMNRELNANAFTVGSDIYFNEGQYNPGSNDGKHLLAHELTHTIQQKGAVSKTSIQKFGATEHKRAGDEASTFFNTDKSTPLQFDLTVGKIPFILTFGDLTMLSGDLFDPRDTMKSFLGIQKSNPSSLLALASKPSSNPGLQPGTQDEIIFAIYDNDKNDPRFEKGKIWESLPDIFKKEDPTNKKQLLSRHVRKAVKDRYLKLASKNYEHFVQPGGKDLGPLSGLGTSAGGSYRALHEDAILKAYEAGLKSESSDQGLMREAAAQHFLQDYFSAGHLRTPRRAIDTHWLKKYPLFFENMKKKIALDMAIYINAHPVDVVTRALTVSIYFDSIYEDVQ
ncbi:MAG: DUF4157 domain-containing protein, partial [Chitinophagales bacterium]